MLKNWRTTVLGGVAALLLFLSNQGVRIGHVGNTDVLGVLGPAAIALIGALAKDKNVTGGTIQQ